MTKWVHELILDVFEFVRSVFPKWFVLEITYSWQPWREPHISFEIKTDELTQKELEKLIDEARKRGYEVGIVGTDIGWLRIVIHSEEVIKHMTKKKEKE